MNNLPLPRWAAELSRDALAHLLGQLLARVCPQCYEPGVIRTSKGAMKYLRCQRCGKRWKVLCHDNYGLCGTGSDT
jgi:ribosomal protein L37AE/L43A